MGAAGCRCGSNRGEMNLGKMGIQICEKLRENLCWRLIGCCHKWDSKAGNWVHQGTAATRRTVPQSVNQTPDPPQVAAAAAVREETQADDN